jgi:hypothetical protein
MKLLINKSYTINDGKSFSFGIKVGIFKGYTKERWPIFDLGEGKTCMINAADESFTEFTKELPS